MTKSKEEMKKSREEMTKSREMILSRKEMNKPREDRSSRVKKSLTMKRMILPTVQLPPSQPCLWPSALSPSERHIQ